MGVGTDEEREWEGGAGIYAPRSYCARSEPVGSESCSLKSLVHIYLRLLPIPSLLATMDGG